MKLRPPNRSKRRAKWFWKQSGTLRQFRPDAVVLRFAGIYGPGRVLRRASLLKGQPVPGDGERFVNLIHVDDGVRAVLAAEENADAGGNVPDFR